MIGPLARAIMHVMEGFSQAQVFGTYRIHGRIASGGMAEVFLATSTNRDSEGQFFALKRLHPHLNSNTAFVNLLIHEAKIGVLLNHPGIATVFDLGSYQSEFFLAMEYVHGKSLDFLFEKLEENPGLKLNIELASYIVMELLRSLAFAHGLKDSKDRPLSIIHRDLSPGNVLISYVGDVKLTDFGIATAESRLQPELSRIALGKLSYMSPEQAVNDPVTAASDLFSLGVLFFELLTEQRPFSGHTSDEVYKSLLSTDRSKLFKDHRYVPDFLQAIVLKMLEKSAKKRYQSAVEAFQAIGGAFKRELQIDFNSRAVRDYYKKKLSEAMRAIFKEDMASELALIQKAMKGEKSSEITKPIRVPPPETGEERTVFEQNYSDEATRQMKISSEERARILAQAKSPPKDESSAFEIPTVSKRIPIIEKIKTSALGKDLREQLSGQLPNLEVNTDQQLQEFEESTFSGEFAFGNESTRVLDPGQVLLHPAENQELAPDLYEATELLPPRVSPFQKLIKTWMRFRSHAKTFGFGILGAAGLVALVLLGDAAIQKLRTPSARLASFQEIDLFTTGTVSSVRLREFVRELQTKEGPFDLQQVSELFNREYRKHKKIPSGEIIRINLQELNGLSLEAPELSDDVVLSSVEKLFPTGEPSRHRFVLFFHPITANSESTEAKRIISSKDLTVVMAPAYPNYKASVLMNLSYAIAKRFGAMSKEDPQTGLSVAPHGFANPFERPLYPQARAELMARDVPVTETTERSPFGLTEIVIGPQTAFELGWISEEARNESLAPQ